MTETENQPPAWYDKQFQHQADVLEMALRFVWACQRQIHRFADGFGARPTIYWDFNKGIVAPVDKARIYDLYRVDGYLVAVLGHQALRWIDKAEKVTGRDLGTRRLRPGIRKHVGTLRDVYEHWVDHLDSFRLNTAKTRAGKRFLRENPNLVWPGDGWKLSPTEGPYLDNLKLNDLFADLRAVEDLLLEAQRDAFTSVGLTMPDGDYQPLAEWHYFPGAVRVDDSRDDPTV